MVNSCRLVIGMTILSLYIFQVYRLSSEQRYFFLLNVLIDADSEKQRLRQSDLDAPFLLESLAKIC
jgi:hypothetical protein